MQPCIIVHDAAIARTPNAHMGPPKPNMTCRPWWGRSVCRKRTKWRIQWPYGPCCFELATFDRAKVAGQYGAGNLGKPCYVTVVAHNFDGSYINHVFTLFMTKITFVSNRILRALTYRKAKINGIHIIKLVNLISTTTSTRSSRVGIFQFLFLPLQSQAGNESTC